VSWHDLRDQNGLCLEEIQTVARRLKVAGHQMLSSLLLVPG